MDRLVSGTAELTPEGWLHIRLDTLLTNCRYGSSPQIKYGLHEILDRFEGRLPFFPQAFLFIEQCFTNPSSTVFDPDNRDWKAISNALKGRVFPDDNGETLSLGLLTRRTNEVACHIHVVPPNEAFLYLKKRLGVFPVLSHGET